MSETSGLNQWIKVMSTYGPFALVVFFAFVCVPKARKAMKEGTPASHRQDLIIYCVNWAAVFAFATISVFAWYQVTFPTEASISGQFRGLQGSETVVVEANAPDAALYLNKQYTTRSGFTYNWKLISRRRLAENEPLRITLDPGDANQAASVYELKIREDYYAHLVLVDYDRSAARMKVRCGSQSTEDLTGVPETARTLTAAPPLAFWKWLWGMSVYAQSAADMKMLTMDLEANDPIIRRKARADLANQGTSAMPTINQLLGNPAASYRQRLGAIYALNQMKTLDVKSLSANAIAAIQRAATEPDPALQPEAQRFLTAHPLPKPAEPVPVARKAARKK